LVRSFLFHLNFILRIVDLLRVEYRDGAKPGLNQNYPGLNPCVYFEGVPDSELLFNFGIWTAHGGAQNIIEYTKLESCKPFAPLFDRFVNRKNLSGCMRGSKDITFYVKVRSALDFCEGKLLNFLLYPGQHQEAAKSFCKSNKDSRAGHEIAFRRQEIQRFHIRG
jgi:hypothetical protein